MASSSSSPLLTENLFNVKGLTALVTGGGSGIGLMLAKALALNGASKVYVVGRRLEKLQEASEHSPSNIIPIQGDVTSKESLADIASQVASEVGHLDLLIANAGIVGPTVDHSKLGPEPSLSAFADHAWSWSMDDFTRTYAMNDSSAFFTVIAFLDLLDKGNKRKKEKGEGPSSQVVVIASIASFLRVVATGFAYISSKAAAMSLTKAFSSYLAPYGIRTNAIAPGFFPSEMTVDMIKVLEQKNPSDEGLQFSRKFIPEGRAGVEEDMAGTIIYLASKAGGYVNGCAIVLDGGRLSILPSTY